MPRDNRRFPLQSAACLSLALLIPATFAAEQSLPTPPPPDAEAQYQNVLSAMKNPLATGVLVTEIMPGSPAGEAGLQAGDIITSYYGTRISNLESLRTQLAQALAHRPGVSTPNPETAGIINAASNGPVLLIASRNGKEILLRVPRESPAIRAIEVEGKVPVPRIPPPSPPGSITLDWKTVLQPDEPIFLRESLDLPLDSDDSAPLAPIPFAPHPSTNAAHTRPSTAPLPAALPEAWIGWQSITLTPEAPDNLTAAIALTLFDPDDSPDPPPAAPPASQRRSTLTVRLNLGNPKTLPIILDTLELDEYNPDLPRRSFSVRRISDKLRIETLPRADPPQTRDILCPPDSLPRAAIPLLAAAMPHDDTSILALHLLYLEDFIARPGYRLMTRGRQPLPNSAHNTPPAPANPPATGPAAQAWQVDLFHCGVLLESYYFNDQKELILIRSAGTTDQLARRVNTEKDATTPLPERGNSARPLPFIP